MHFILVLSLLLCVLNQTQASVAKAYGYYQDANQKSHVFSIDAMSGVSKESTCDLSKLPALSGGSMASDRANGLLYYFANVNEKSSLVKFNPVTCATTVLAITGLGVGQSTITDIKFVGNQLYMVFPDDNCLRGSFYHIDTNTGKVLKFITTVVDPVGFDQVTGLSAKDNKYYFAGAPFPPISPDYILNIVDVQTGDAANLTLVNNNLKLGDSWDTNYTMNAYDSSSGTMLVGAVSPPSDGDVKCMPAGFYTVDTKTAKVTCTYGPLKLKVFPLADFDPVTSIYYQVFTDTSFNKFYLVTFDVINQKFINQVPCDACQYLTAFNIL